MAENLDEKLLNQPSDDDRQKKENFENVQQKQRNQYDTQEGSRNKFLNKQQIMGAKGAAAGALKGGAGAVDAVKAGVSWWVLDLVFGSLFTVIGFIPALIYLDLHFVLNKLGSKLFGPMNLWQKILLVIANLIALLIPMLFVLFIYAATCGNSLVSGTAKLANIASFGSIQNFCSGSQGGGQSGGGGGGATGGLDIILTSAYRPGPPSADSRGETVDIALRNPTDPIGSMDPRIAQLIQIIVGVGFTAPQGYIQNEYTNPSAGATAGHVHVQFNLKSDGTTYCDGARVPNPPTDLVAIPSSIPMSGVSNPKLRQCMLTKLISIFNAAGFGP